MAALLKPHQLREVRSLPSVDRQTTEQPAWPSPDDLDGSQPQTTQQPYCASKLKMGPAFVCLLALEHGCILLLGS